AAAAHRDTFANDTVTANDEPALRKVIVANLPNPAQHGLGMYNCPSADPRVAGHDDVRLQLHALAENDVCADQTKWPDLDAVAQLRSVFDNRRGMHRHVQPASLMRIIALNSASAHSASPTKAFPSNFHTGPRCCNAFTGMRSISPGTTGFRKRALSIPIKKTLGA